MKYAGTRDYCTCGLFYIDISGYIWHNEKENVLNKGSLYPPHSYIKFMLDKYPVFVQIFLCLLYKISLKRIIYTNI